MKRLKGPWGSSRFVPLLETLGAGPAAAYDTAMRWRLRAIASSICP
jgi:hypothetical protein